MTAPLRAPSAPERASPRANPPAAMTPSRGSPTAARRAENRPMHGRRRGRGGYPGRGGGESPSAGRGRIEGSCRGGAESPCRWGPRMGEVIPGRGDRSRGYFLLGGRTGWSLESVHGTHRAWRGRPGLPRRVCESRPTLVHSDDRSGAGLDRRRMESLGGIDPPGWTDRAGMGVDGVPSLPEVNVAAAHVRLAVIPDVPMEAVEDEVSGKVEPRTPPEGIGNPDI